MAKVRRLNDGTLNPFYGERLCMWTAHEMKTARESFLRLEEFLAGHRALAREVRSVDRGRGYECIYFRNNSRIRFLARSKGSGRGFTGDLIILDEAYALDNTHISALMPTLSARRNPQIIYMSTPPLDTYSGEVLFALRDRAIVAQEQMIPNVGVDIDEWSLAWLEWSNKGSLDDVGRRDPDSGKLVIDLNDRSLWHKSNPAIAAKRIKESFVAGELRSMQPRDFAREVLVIWPPKPAPVTNPITAIDWRMLTDEESELDFSKGVVIATDITPRKDHAAIAAYGKRPDGTGHAELIEHRPGVDWLTTRLLEIKHKWNPLLFIIDGAGPAGAHVEDIERAELITDTSRLELVTGLTTPRNKVKIKQATNRHEPERGDLIVMSATDMGNACGKMESGVRQRNFVHLGENRVEVALAGAAIRNIQDGGWGWARRQSSVDISPLVTFTEAKWGWETFAHLVPTDYDPLQFIG